jgi:hypothetical protein
MSGPDPWVIEAMLRYLDGALGPEGVAALARRLTGDARSRRDVALLLVELAHLRDLAAELGPARWRAMGVRAAPS